MLYEESIKREVYLSIIGIGGISAMLYVSSRTHFVNNGSRDNAGVVQSEGVESEGVIIGELKVTILTG